MPRAFYELKGEKNRKGTREEGKSTVYRSRQNLPVELFYFIYLKMPARPLEAKKFFFHVGQTSQMLSLQREGYFLQ